MLSAELDAKMLRLSEIQYAIQAGTFRITDHADEEAQADHLNYDELLFSVLHGEIIETYLKDRPFPSCLVLGRTFEGDPIHSVWAYNKENAWAVLITVYRPDPKRWINWKERKRL